jgi:hypothetical protein
MKLCGAVLLLGLMIASAARAQAPDLTCRNGSFPQTETSIGLAKVVGAGRLTFLEDTDGCPGPAAACRQRAYVVAGDRLLTGRRRGEYVCAFFANRGGGSAGWVERARLGPLPVDAAPPPRAWVGRWADGDDTIALSLEHGALVADGNAYWPSAAPPLAQFPGGPNLGELSGTAKPKANRVVFADADPQGCSASLTLIGDFLVVDDNQACGGHNVSFSGVYRRK